VFVYVHASVVCVALYVELSYGDLCCIAAVKFLSPVPYVIVAVFVLVSYLLTFVLLCTKCSRVCVCVYWQCDVILS